MTKRWIRWTLASLALTAAASAGFACDHDSQAAEAKNTATPAAKSDAKGCDMPCCAHTADAANVKTAAAAPADKPCSGHDAKGCPKKAAAVAKQDAPKESPKAEPATDSGTHR